MKIIWMEGAWNEYTGLLSKDKRSLKKVNELLKSINRNGNHYLD